MFFNLYYITWLIRRRTKVVFVSIEIWPRIRIIDTRFGSIHWRSWVALFIYFWRWGSGLLSVFSVRTGIYSIFGTYALVFFISCTGRLFAFLIFFTPSFDSKNTLGKEGKIILDNLKSSLIHLMWMCLGGYLSVVTFYIWWSTCIERCTKVYSRVDSTFCIGRHGRGRWRSGRYKHTRSTRAASNRYQRHSSTRLQATVSTFKTYPISFPFFLVIIQGSQTICRSIRYITGWSCDRRQGYFFLFKLYCAFGG